LHADAAKTAPSADQADESRPPILIRATDGKTGNPNPKSKDGAEKRKASKQEKLKLSTVVDQGDLEAFYARYAEVCKGGMTGLKKRDRKKGRAKKGGAAKVTKS
jgi:signal recognition particle subunit SRP14